VQELVQTMLGGQAGLRGMGSAELRLFGMSDDQCRQALGSRSFLRMRVDQKLVSNPSELEQAAEMVL
jgi:hypothetical protein